MNKQQLQVEANKLQKQLDILKAEINKPEEASIGSYSDICKALSIKELSLRDFKQYGEQANKLLAHHQLFNITKYYNRNGKIDFSNQNQRKYYNYWEFKNGRWVFCCVYYHGSVSFCSGGFYFLNEADAKLCSSLFYDIYVEVLTPM